MEVVREWWAVIWAAVLTAASVVQLLLSKTYAKREELDAVKEDMTRLNAVVAALPDSKQIHQLELNISELRGELKALREQLKPVNHLANLLLEERLKG